jgi:hypothetical protein
LRSSSFWMSSEHMLKVVSVPCPLWSASAIAPGHEQNVSSRAEPRSVASASGSAQVIGGGKGGGGGEGGDGGDGDGGG